MLSENHEYESLLNLSAVPGIGPGKMRALVGYFQSASKIFRASARTLVHVEGIDTKTAENIKKHNSQDFAAKQLRELDKLGGRLVTFWDEEYPESLKQIYDPPAMLFVKGELTAKDKYAIAIVGTRQPSHYGRKVAEKLTTELARKGLTIVSGLAYGIDTLAHRFALQSMGRTIAVLGSGLNVIYPRENSSLAKKIITNGALISEYPLGTGPDRNNFPKRNRIVCGMSLGVIVVEAGIKSGALITASIALEQNREVFAIPGNIDSPKSIGTNDLIKQGAKAVTSTEDILEELYPKLGRFIEHQEVQVDDIKLDGNEKKIFEILSHEPQHIDSLALNTKLTTSKVLSILLALELKNVIKQLPGKLFVRT